MGVFRVSVTLKGGVYYGTILEHLGTGDDRILGNYRRAWHEVKTGEQPEPAIEQLLDFAESEALKRNVEELGARWTEAGPEVIE